MTTTRRAFLTETAGPLAGLALFASAFGRPLTVQANGTTGRFGELSAPSESGLRLPSGFTSRVVARTGDPVADTDHVWHAAPDGGGCFARPDGGWIYASNSELNDGRGGVSCMSFTADGEIDDAYPILSGTSINCAGGATPWGTWLSCEEFSGGIVWECDPHRRGQGVARPALGTFAHEAAAVDPETGATYLTEDRSDGRLYRFVPDRPGDLGSGSLFAAATSADPSMMRPGDVADVTWRPTSADEPDRSPLTAAFNGGEGIWIDERRMLFTTKNDRRVWALDLSTSTLSVLHDCIRSPQTPLDAVDNITVHPITGGVYVAEDGGDMQICVLRDEDDGVLIDAFLQFVGHDDSEVTGPAFSPDGQRMYVSSQRGLDGRGITYEISGPFDDPDLFDGQLARARRMSLPPSPQASGTAGEPTELGPINGPAKSRR